ncbi:MAG: type I restriction-modification system subunit M, partial [Balneolaceae bacterium]|nr:type I restriction-modification system subunit M [Balneolaceae bacterium]
IFYKYLAEKMEIYANAILKQDKIIYKKIDEDSKNGQAMLEAIKEESLEKLGYFLKPSELFSEIAKRGNGNGEKEGVSNFILEDLQKILINIQNSTMGTDSEEDFDHLFEDMDLNSTKLGKTPEARNEVIAKVLAHLNKIDFKLEQTELDVLGDAYEYLIGQFASGAGKKAGEFYTPQQVSMVLAKLVTTGKKKLKSVYDPTCGSGSLLLRVAKEVQEVSNFYGQELNRTTYNLARMNMILHDVHYRRFDIKQEDTLEHPQHLDMQFEAIVANPPFSAKWSANPLFTSDDRFSQYGKLAPKSKADFAFVQHMIHHLAENGIMAIVLPHGALFRSGAEQHIRRYLIEDRNYLDAVIGLPANIFYGTSIPTCILVFKKCREFPDEVLFIDASKHYLQSKNQNYLREQDIDKIVTTYRERLVEEKYSHLARLSEIKQNEFNLNIPRYVNPYDPDPKIDLNFVVENLRQVENESKRLQIELDKKCKALNIAPPVGNNVHWLKEYKDGVIQMVFRREIRFNDSEGNPYPDWKQRKLGQVATFLKGKNISKSDIVPNGNTPCIRYGELYTHYDEVITTIQSSTNLEPKFLHLSKKNDVIIPASGETAIDISTAACVTVEGVALGGDLNIIRSPLNGIFLSYYLNYVRKKDIARLAQGISVIHIYSTQLKLLEIEIPCVEEQNKIAGFLFDIDSLINNKIKLYSHSNSVAIAE